MSTVLKHEIARALRAASPEPLSLSRARIYAEAVIPVALGWADDAVFDLRLSDPLNDVEGSYNEGVEDARGAIRSLWEGL